MIHGGTRILCEKGRAVTKSWPVVEQFENIAHGAWCYKTLLLGAIVLIGMKYEL